MKLIQTEVGAMQNFCYVAGCAATGRAALVDPAWEVDRMLEAARREGLVITDLLVTHTHPDHIEGLGAAQRATGATVSVHALEADRARARLAAQGGDTTAVRPLAGDDLIRIGDLEIRALHTPGHTPGAICYLTPAGEDHPAGVLTGDTLFIGRCGRTDFPGSDPVAMYHSLRRLASLPEDTIVYPGHNYADRPTSTIGRERTHNVHMSADGLDEFLVRRMGPDAVARFRT